MKVKITEYTDTGPEPAVPAPGSLRTVRPGVRDEEWFQRSQAIQSLGEIRGGRPTGHQAHRTVTVARRRLLAFPFWVTTYNS